MIKSKKQSNHIEIDLTGPQGNAFYLLAQAQSIARQMNLDYEVINSEMKSSDYEHLVETFDKYFGKYVILYR